MEAYKPKYNLKNELEGNYLRKVVTITDVAGNSLTKHMLNHVLTNLENDSTSTNESILASYKKKKLDYLILDIGLSKIGRQINDSLKPYISVITSINQNQHNSYINPSELEAEILAGIVSGGFTLLNKEMPYYNEIKSIVVEHGSKVITYGLKEDADIYLMESALKQDFIYARVNIWEKEIEYEIPFLEEEKLINILAVIGATWLLELDLEEASKQLKKFYMS